MIEHNKAEKHNAFAYEFNLFGQVIVCIVRDRNNDNMTKCWIHRTVQNQK